MPKLVMVVPLTDALCRTVLPDCSEDPSVTDESAAGPVRPGVTITVTEDFDHRLDAHRRELLAFCYRMLGSVHDAEDAVQDTMLRAWRAARPLRPGQASVRTWLYRIATNVCLTAAAAARSPGAAGDLGGRATTPRTARRRRTEISWLQPLPDALVADPTRPRRRPARSSCASPLVAAMQRLPARQRAAVILREALDARPREIAEVLDTHADGREQRPATGPGDARRTAGPRPAGLDPTMPGAGASSTPTPTAFERADVAAITRARHGRRRPGDAPRADLVRRSRRLRALHGRGVRPARRRVADDRDAGQRPAGARRLRTGAAGALEMHSYQVLDVRPAGIRRTTVFYDHALMVHLGVPAQPI